MNRYDVLDIFDFSIFTSTLDQIDIESKCLINTLNQYSYIIAEKDRSFKKALMESDILLPDGIGIVAAVKMLRGKSIKKIAGADLHSYLLKRLNAQRGRCFYLGSSEGTLQDIKSRIGKEHPAITVGCYSPPFKSHFNETDNVNMISHINEFNPDVLFVGMTAPKQEKWTYAHKDQLNAKVICSIGAVFDFYAGTVARPGQFWINLGLEWLVRLINEPNHMWKRYVYYGPIFVYIVLKEKVKMMLFKKHRENVKYK